MITLCLWAMLAAPLERPPCCRLYAVLRRGAVLVQGWYCG